MQRVKIADSFFKRFKGLMFERAQDFNYALIFPLETESRLEASIHMLFVFFPIDVLWLNREKRVVDKRESLKPFVLNAMPKKPAAFIIELPEGAGKNISIGDVLDWGSSA